MKKILVADDDIMICESMKNILKTTGVFESDCAFDGEEIMQKIRQNKYDAVLLDIALPTMDGYTLLKKIRDIMPSLPVIFLTGTAKADKVVESVTKYKLNGFVEKPFNGETVLRILRDVIKVD
ncbi:MAG: response regulator [Patescibacteria group bacterium]